MWQPCEQGVATLTPDSIEPSVAADSVTPSASRSYGRADQTEPKTVRAVRPSAAATAKLRSHVYSGYCYSRNTSGRGFSNGNGYRSYEAGAAPPRRRLRREIRWIAWGALSTLPFIAAFYLLRGRAAEAFNVETPNTIAVPFSAGVDPQDNVTNPAASIVFPGYLLPDDGSTEDHHHAGG